MALIGWAALGWLVGTVLESVVLRVGGEPQPACGACGSPEGGPSSAALARAVATAGWRCRRCGSWSIWSLAILGPALAVSFALLAARWSPGPELLAAAFYATLLALVATLDLRHRLVYELVTYPATALAMVVTPLVFGQPAWSGLAGGLLLGAVFAIFHLLGVLLYRREVLGRGDVMIAALVGAMVGLPGSGTALVLGTLFGGLASLGVGLVRRSRRAEFAYGPALCLGGLVALLVGP